MGDRAMRPFWLHQLAEYVIGLLLVAQGMQDPEPVVPVLGGVVVLVNAAAVQGPLGAFRLVGRRLHRWLDVGVMAALAVGALQPWLAIEATGRVVMLVILVPLGFLWYYTDWAERRGRADRRLARTSGRGDDIGRTAGRLAGGAVNAIKKRAR